MARDRKRAKQRRERRGGSAAGNGAGADGGRSGESAQPTPALPSEAHIPGALEHASADVDEFDAALVSGAGGVPAAPGSLPGSDDDVDAENDPRHLSEPEIEREAESEGELSSRQRDQIASGDGSHEATPEQASGAALPRSGSRVMAFLRASWAELHRVQWPDRPQVFQATAVVLGFVVVAGLYLGLADFVAKEIVEAIL